MKKYKRYLPYLLVALATVVIFIVVKAVQNAQFEKLLEVPEMEQGLLTEPQNYEGRSWIVPARYVFDTGLTEEELQPLNNPTFDSVATADTYLADTVVGIHIEANGEHRFYSNQILNWHEVVNDTFGGEDIAVTLSTLTRSGIVYSRNFNGQTLQFGNARLAYNNNSILKDDKTDNLWLQAKGVSISGEDMGETLKVIPSTTLTWSKFKELYPDGQALSNETGYNRDYARHPYTSYDNTDLVYFPLTGEPDGIDAKWIITAVHEGDESIAFSHEIENGFVATNEEVGGKSIVSLWNGDEQLVRVFDRTVDGETLTFSFSFENGRITDEETGSTWNADGLAISGELSGTQLEVVQSTQFFFFAWNLLWPNQTIANVGSADDAVESVEEEEERQPLSDLSDIEANIETDTE